MKNKPAFNGTQVQIKYHLAWEAWKQYIYRTQRTRRRSKNKNKGTHTCIFRTAA
jgi:hypothetical protein